MNSSSMFLILINFPSRLCSLIRKSCNIFELVEEVWGWQPTPWVILRLKSLDKFQFFLNSFVICSSRNTPAPDSHFDGGDSLWYSLDMEALSPTQSIISLPEHVTCSSCTLDHRMAFCWSWRLSTCWHHSQNDFIMKK